MHSMYKISYMHAEICTNIQVYSPWLSVKDTHLCKALYEPYYITVTLVYIMLYV